MKQVFFDGYEGRRLAGLLFAPSPSPHYSVVVCHGFQGSKEGGGRAVDFAGELAAHGLGALLFDFGGTGESEGCFADLTLSGYIADIYGALDFMRSAGLGGSILLGRSLGGCTALLAAARRQDVQGVCTWSTPGELERAFRLIWGSEKFAKLSQGQKVAWSDEWGSYTMNPGVVADLGNHDVLKAAACLSPRPLLVVHGSADELVSVKQAAKIYDAASEPKSLRLIEAGDHRFLTTQRQARNATISWLAEHFGVLL